MIRKLKALAVGALLISLAACQGAPSEKTPDVVIVGAGIAGLSAAVEAANHDAKVLVVDMWSVFGGHALVSEGGLCLIGTPLQEQQGIQDTPEIAIKDFFDWGVDPNPEWVNYYARNSRAEIHDWLGSLGVTFEQVVQPPGNSRPRFHLPRGRGYGLVSPIYAAAVGSPNVEFRFNAKAVGLLQGNHRIVGVRVQDMRTEDEQDLHARAVVVATGGFQSNLALVREYWPQKLPVPRVLLAGSGVNSQGSGLGLVKQVGGSLHHLDRMWNYATGVRDPRYPGQNRGLRPFASAGVWINKSGRRFVNETAGERTKLAAVLQQPDQTYWHVFDQKNRGRFRISGSDWTPERVDRLFFQDSEMVASSDSIRGLAEIIGVPADVLQATIRRYNQMVKDGSDQDFGRFSKDKPAASRRRRSPPQGLETPPFYAYQGFPLARKSMGGILTDRHTRVLDHEGNAIPGLYAAGEATGFGGINGIAGLEGTFLGPSLLMGRVAGAKLVEDLARGEPALETDPELVPMRSHPTVPEVIPREVNTAKCLLCHDLNSEIKEELSGYAHFRLVHAQVLERKENCGACHGELSQNGKKPHSIDAFKQIAVCRNCHLAAR